MSLAQYRPPAPPLLTTLLMLLWPPPHLCQHADSSDPLAWLRESVRGSPGVDYPIYGVTAFSLSTFSCEDRVKGVHYADPGLGCQVFHVCDTLTRTPTRISFICPNGTLYSQTHHVCDWWWRVNCSKAREQYKMTEILFAAPSKINQDIFKEKQRETENFSSGVDYNITKEIGSSRSIPQTDKERKKIARKTSPSLFEKDNIKRVKISQQKRKSSDKRPGLRGIPREDENLIGDQFESKKLPIGTSEDDSLTLPSYDKRRAKYKREKIFRLHKNPTKFNVRI